MNPIFITGGTGYIGKPLIEALLARGFSVHALARPESVNKLPSGAMPVIGNALDEATFADKVPPAATFVHLVGTPHPSPAKAAEFRRVDLTSIRASVGAARRASVKHLVYVSVAQPAPVMKAYIAARQEGEALVRSSGIRATILRPWYVLGPGHWWPYLLVPVYAILRWIPSTRERAERLGLVTRQAMIAALVRAVETPPTETVRIVEVPAIRRPYRKGFMVVTPFETKRLPAAPDATAPDGTAVRLLLALKGGSMAHFELLSGLTSKAVTHRTVEEIWFFLSGRGEMWRTQTGQPETIVQVEAGICLTIPLGTHFQLRSLGAEPLSAVAITMPPWPGDDEARIVHGKWEATVDR